MKINIGGYDVEISAKKDYKARSSKRDTLAFLNYLSLIFDDAGEFQRAQNGNPYAEESKQKKLKRAEIRGFLKLEKVAE